MKRPRLFVLLFYHITFQFATNAAVNKPQQTTTPVDSLAHFSSFRYFYEIFSYLSAWGWWENGLVCQRRAAILRRCRKGSILQNSCASPWGRPLTDFALLSLFSGAPKGTEAPKVYRFCCGFVSVSFGNCRETVHLPCLLFPAVKVYAISKKSRRYQF